MNRCKPSQRDYVLLSAELDKLRSQFVARDSNMNTRALVLIGSSAILSATGIVKLDSWLQVVAVASVLAAVILGVVALRSTTGEEFSLDGVAGGIEDKPDDLALEIIYKSKKSAYNDDRNYLKKRGRIVNVGFWLLVLGIVLSLSSLLISNAHQLGI